MELVPPNSEKMTKFIEDSNISTKKVKVQVRACQTPNFVAKLQQKVKVSQTLTWTFTFLVGIFAISSELSNFSLLGGTSQKNHPVVFNNLNYEYEHISHRIVITRVAWLAFVMKQLSKISKHRFSYLTKH